MMGRGSRKTGSARAALLITLVVFLVWALLWAAVWYQATGGGLQLGLRSSYLKIELSPQKSLWVEVKGRRSRTAETPQALERADWVQVEGWDWEYREHWVNLAIEPEDVGLQRASLGLDTMGRQFRGTWRIGEKDARGGSWECAADGEVRAARSPGRAKAIQIPRLSSADLRIVPQAEDQEGKPVVRVALQLHDAGFDISDVRVGGSEVQGEARVRDASGKVVGKKKAELADLGFT